MPVGEDNFEVHDTIQEFFTSILSEGERRELGSFSLRRLSLLASGAYSGGNFVACINYLSNALQLSLSVKEGGPLREQLGDAYERIGDLPAALVAYKEAERAAGEGEDLVRLHRKTAFALQARGDVASAMAEAEAGEAGLTSLGEAPTPEVGWLNLVRSRINIHIEHWAEAREYGGEALRLFRMLDIRSGQAQALLALGDIEIDSPKGDPRVAESHFLSALDLCTSPQDEGFAARVLTALARLCIYRFRDMEKAAMHMGEIERLPKALDDPQIRQSLGMLKGWVNLEVHADFRAAAENFKEAMALARKTYDAQGVVSARYALAEVSYFERRLHEAKEEFERCASEWIQQGFLGTAVESLWMVAECCLAMTDIDGFRLAVARFGNPELAWGIEARPVLVKVARGLDCLLQGDGDGFHAYFSDARSLAGRELAAQEWTLAAFVQYFYGFGLRVLGQEEGGEILRHALELMRAHGLKARSDVGVSIRRQTDELVEIFQRASKIS